MSGSEIVQIVSLFLTATVTIVGLLVRAKIIGLEEKVDAMTIHLKAANQMILEQGRTITQLSQQLVMEKPQTYQASPPYVRGK